MQTTSSSLSLRDEPDEQTLPLGSIERYFVRRLEDLACGQLTVEFASGMRRTFGKMGAKPHAILKVKSNRVALRLLASGSLGLAEGFIAEELETPDLAAFLRVCARNLGSLENVGRATPALRLFNRVRHTLRANTRVGSKRNIAAHYDLGNDFYRLWLDAGMTYSSAMFESPGEPLDAAQRRKYLALAHALDLRPGDRVLEIG
ncbi:MAG: class I SAM-dependent methyltransferase, partial [Rhodospirillaceae bacterium]